MPRNTRSATRSLAQANTIEDNAGTTTENAKLTQSRRRVRAPKGALAKLKASAKAASSLPPSSPTHSLSSKGQEPDSIPIASEDPELEIRQPTLTPQGSPPLDEQKILLQDFDAEGSDDPDEEQDVSTASDPFGFFRVERVLKQDRAMSEIPICPTPKAEPEALLPPSTPRRRRSSSITHRATRDPSGTPSPIKPTTSGHPVESSDLPSDPSQGVVEMIDEALTGNLTDLSEVEDTSPPKPSKKGKGKQRAAKKSLDPSEIQKEWDSVLPKRTLRTRKRGKYEKSDGEEEKDTPPIRKKAKVSRTKARKDQKLEEEELDDKYAKEREERLAYYKRLQSYEVAKENVFVV